MIVTSNLPTLRANLKQFQISALSPPPPPLHTLKLTKTSHFKLLLQTMCIYVLLLLLTNE